MVGTEFILRTAFRWRLMETEHISRSGPGILASNCVVAGFWQLDRPGERRDFNARVDRQLTLAPQPLDQVITPGSRIDPEAVAYRRVEVEGTYDPSREVVLVGRSLDDQSGNDLTAAPRSRPRVQ